MKKVIVSVTNDLVTDRRVSKSCKTLHTLGYDVLLVGRKLPNSMPMDSRPYKTIRMRLLFKRGPLFYAEYNIRLFLLLIFKKFDLLLANDLDTLLANYIAGSIKNKEIVYDSHEYFTEVPELQNNRIAKKTWEKIEAKIFPRLKNIITVNESISELYNAKYGKKPLVVRNIPVSLKSISEIKINVEKGNSKMLIMQGAGINIDRGAEELVEAMQYVNNAILYIIGGGDVIPHLKQMISTLKLENKVKLLPKMPYQNLMAYTSQADLGLSLDKNTNINYLYSLPNKLFDYIRSNVPVLTSNMVEVAKIVKTYKVGEIAENHDPKYLALKINTILADEEKLSEYRQNCETASKELSWENEEKILIKLYKKFL